MSLTKSLKALGCWTRKTFLVSAAVLFTWAAAWAAGVSVPANSKLEVNSGKLYVELDSNSGTITNAGEIVTTDGSIYLNGNWTSVGAGTYNPGTGKVYFTAATGTQTLIAGAPATDSFYDIVHPYASTLVLSTNTLNIKNDLRLAAGVLNIGIGTVNIQGDWINTSTTVHSIVPNSSLVNLNGDNDQTIYGANEFFQLNKTLTGAGRTLYFESSKEQVVSDYLTLLGNGDANLLAIRSTTDGTPGLLTLQTTGLQELQYLDVKDNDASNGRWLVARHSPDHSAPAYKALHWMFGGVTIKWTGAQDDRWNNPYNWDLNLVPISGDTAIVRSVDEDNSNAPIPRFPKLTANATVGNLVIRSGSSLTMDQRRMTVEGAFTHDGTLIFDGLAGETFATASILDNGTVKFIGTQSGVTTVDMATHITVAGVTRTTFNNLVVEEENTSIPRDTFTNTLALTVTHDMTLIEGAVTAGAGLSWSVGDNLNVQGATVNASGGDVASTNMTLASGAFTAPGSTRSFTLSGNFTRTAATFDANGGTLVLNGTGGASAVNQTLSGNTTFYRLTKQVSSAPTETGVHTLTVTAGSDIVVTDHLTLTGPEAARRLRIRSDSTSPGFLTLQFKGAQTIQNVDVQYNSAAHGMTLVGRGDSVGLAGTVPNWEFGEVTIKWIGEKSVDWNNQYNWDLGLVPQANDLVEIRTIDHDHGTTINYQPELTSDINIGSLTITDANATLKLKGYNMTVTSATAPTPLLNNNGTIYLYGKENLAIDSVNATAGTFYYTGEDDSTSNSYVITNGTRPAQFFNIVINDPNAQKDTFIIDKNITVNGSITMTQGTFNTSANNVDLNGSFIQTGGTFVAPASTQTFTIAGDFMHPSGIFNPNGGTVTLDATSTTTATNQTFTGNTTFFKLVKQIPAGTSAAHQLTFTAGSTQTIDANGSLTLTGRAAAGLVPENNLLLRSSSSDADPVNRTWNISLQPGGLQTISHVDVDDSDASVGGGLLLVARNSPDHTDGHNDTHWMFRIPIVTWSGRTSVDWADPSNWDLGLMPISGDDVVIPDSGTTTYAPSLTAASGAASLRDVELQVGAVLTLDGYNFEVLGEFSNKGNIIAKGSETIHIVTPDIMYGTFTYTGTNTGTIPLNLFDPAHTVLMYHNLVFTDSGAVDTFQPQVDMSVYGTLTMTSGVLDASTVTRHLNVTSDMNLNGGTLNATSGNIAVGGDVVFAGGTLLAPSGTTITAFTVGGDWTYGSGTFTPNDGRVTLTGTGTATVSGNSVFHDFSIYAPSGKTVYFTAASNQTIQGNLGMTGGESTKIMLRSTIDTNKWTLTIPNGFQTVTDVDVKDSIALVTDATRPYIVAFNSVDQKVGVNSTNSGWFFTDLILLAPLDNKEVGQVPVIIGRSMPNEAVYIQDAANKIVASTTADSNGHFRVAVGQDEAGVGLTGTSLALNGNTLTPYWQGFAGNPSNITVVDSPTTSQTPVIDTPVDGTRVQTPYPTITGRGKPGAWVYIIGKTATTPYTILPEPYAGEGQVLPDGTFSITLSRPMLRGNNMFSVLVDGVSSTVLTYIVNDIFGVVFDSARDRLLKNAKVYIYNADGSLARPGVELNADDINPYVTGTDGYYLFRGATFGATFFMHVESSGYEYPSKMPNAELPPARHVVTGSKKEMFTMGNVFLNIDHPMDAAAGLLRVEKASNKSEAKIGEVVTYTVTIENLTENNVDDTRLHDMTPPGFKFLDGRVLLDGLPLVNPSGARPLIFNVGSFTSKQKKAVRYQLVVGSGIAPGTYENTAHMRYHDKSMIISNIATATVKVIVDPLFDAGTVFGKVFLDLNENGRQDAPEYVYEDRQEIIEAPVANVRIVMEDGTVVTSDKNGQFHIPGLLPGRHLLRLDERTLPKGYYLTTDKVQVLDVTAGSTMKVNFGVNMDNAQVTGEDAQFFNSKVRIDRNADQPKPRLNVDMFNNSIQIHNGAPVDKIEFRIFTNYAPFIQAWKLDVIDRDTKRVVKAFKGTRFNMNDPVYWDGRTEDGKYLRQDRNYAYLLKVEDGANHWDETKERTFTVKEMTEAEWTEYSRIKSEKEKSEAATARLKKYRDWTLAKAVENNLDKQTIFVKGETVTIAPLAADLRHVRVLKGGDLFIDVPVPERHGLTARELLDGVSQQEAPLEIILPDGDYELDVVSSEMAAGNGGASSVTAEVPTPPSGEKPDLQKTGKELMAGTPAEPPAGGADRDATAVAQHRWPIKVGEDYMMFVAMGDGKVGYNINRGNIEPVQSVDSYRPGFYQQGKMAYYLKGKIKGKYLVTSSFDTERQQKEMFRGLDQDAYYPVYGDASSINYDATNTQGPLYLLVEWDKSKAIWGNYAVDFNDNEFARYTRTLYGGQLDYTSVASTPYGDAKTKVALFHAEVRQRSAHNEFLGTGGSLYYTKHQDIVQGSDKIKVEVRDAVTGVIKATADMKQGVDYDMDYSEGRILFWRPVSMAVGNTSIISNDLLNGDPVYVVMDYEYLVKDKIVEGTQGARVAQAVSNNVIAGATYVSETQSGGNYQMKGQDVTVRMNKDASVKVEYAETQSQDSGAYISTDGGLSFSEVGGAKNIQGRAYGITQDARLFDRLGLRSYYKWVDPGFSTAGTTAMQGKELKGLNMTFDLTPVTRLTASYDIQKLIDQGNLSTQMQVGAQETRTTALQLVHDARQLRITAEYRNQQVSNSDGKYDTAANTMQSTAAFQAEYKLNEKTDVSIKQQANFQDRLTQATTLGVKRQITDRLSGTLEETLSADGTATKAGLSANVTQNLALMTDYSVTAPKTGAALTTATVGAKGQVNETTSLETTYGVTQSSEGASRSVIALGGATQIDKASIKAAADIGTDANGQVKQGFGFDASRKDEKSAHETASGVRVDETADGQKTTLSYTESGNFTSGINMAVERSLGIGTSMTDRLDSYKLAKSRNGLKTETSYGRKYSESQTERSATNIFGLSGDINDRWAASAQVEQGKVQNADGSKTDRVAVATGLGYVGKDPETGEEMLKSSTKAELRFDRGGSNNKDQFLVYQSAEGKVDDETTLSAKFEASETKNLDTDKAEAKYKEIVLGVAYRPIAADRLNTFGRYTYKENQKPSGQSNTTDVEKTKMHVLSAEGVYDINDKWQVVERIAYRIMEEKVSGFEFAKTHTWLMVNRLNYRLNQDWKIGGEYRILTQREAKDQKRGFLVEAVRSVNDNVELGIGYNFTDFIDDLTNLSYTIQGPFIRMTGKLYDRTPEERAKARAKWIERRVENYAWHMVRNEFNNKNSPIVQELNRRYQTGKVANEQGRYEEARAIYKDVILATQVMFEEAAQFVRQHIAFEERLFNASERAREYYEKGEYWMAKKLWEKILEEAEKAVLQ